jgi:DnaJ-class molecular chaperone
MIKNYYQLLDISNDASSDDIKKAYRLYAKKFHPDKHDGDKFFEERFKEVQEAYDVLSNSNEREAYDEKLFGKQTDLHQSPDNNEHSNSDDNDLKNNFSGGYQHKTSETPEEKTKREIKEKRTKGCLIGIGTGIVFFILLSFGDGWHVPIGIAFLIWTIRQIFVVFTTFLKD